MAKNEAIAKAIAADPYLKKRKAPTEAEQQLYLKEVSFFCPLCGKILRHKKQGKANKLYEIAHIFPNSPTEEQYELLSKLPRLGNNSESFENKIALCKDCQGHRGGIPFGRKLCAPEAFYGKGVGRTDTRCTAQ